MKKNIELRIFKVWLLQYTDLQYYVGLWSWKVKYFNFIQFDRYIWMITNEVLQTDVKITVRVISYLLKLVYSILNRFKPIDGLPTDMFFSIDTRV